MPPALPGDTTGHLKTCIETITMVNEDSLTYRVVVNHEEQYSIWLADRELPLGWNDAGFSGDKAACLDYIKNVWTDMRPQSLRKRMEDDAP
jgi:MbtH protein